MPQGDRTPEESEAFGRMLANINLLFLGSSVLILLDMSYSSRLCAARDRTRSSLRDLEPQTPSHAGGWVLEPLSPPPLSPSPA